MKNADRQGSQWFSMPRGDLWYLLAIVVFAVVAFAVWNWDTSWAGMVAFGWFMAALMVWPPLVGLAHLLRRRTGRADKDKEMHGR